MWSALGRCALSGAPYPCLPGFGLWDVQGDVVTVPLDACAIPETDSASYGRAWSRRGMKGNDEESPERAGAGRQPP